jgi:hypothetical protein
VHGRGHKKISSKTRNEDSQTQNNPVKIANVVLCLKPSGLPSDRNHSSHQARRGLVENPSLSDTYRMAQNGKKLEKTK